MRLTHHTYATSFHVAQVESRELENAYELGLVYAKNLVDKDHPVLIVWLPQFDRKSESTKGPVRAPAAPCSRRN